jgi:inorganic pyrophosphatase
MGIESVSPGHDVPNDINVVIEIPANSDPVKYEVEKKSGLLMVDRFVGTSMCYPCNYGFVPQTLSEDGDPVDVLVITPFPLYPGALIRARPIGMLRMTDESGPDAKILAVPVSKLTSRYDHVKTPADLGQDFLAIIEHFFQHYKDLEKNKWVKIDGWESLAKAQAEIIASIERYQPAN